MRTAVGLLCAAALAVLAGPAAAAIPPVDVRTEGPLSFDFAALSKEGTVTIHVRNSTAENVKVNVRVTGDPALQRLITATAKAVNVSPGDREIPLKVTGTPDVGTLKGTLVIAPVLGGAVARRELTVTVKEESTPAAGANLDPVGLPDVTVPATNFLPSPLTPFGPLLIVLAAVFAAMLWIWWRWLAAKGRGAPWVLTIAACGLVAIGVEFADYKSDRAGTPGPSAIVAEKLAVSSTVEPGRVGIVLDGEGDIAELSVSKTDELLVTDLEHAGAYKGKIDLDPSAEEGSADATVNVRDWWPWALLAIVIGVAVGYRVRKWFDRDRPREQLRQRARKLSNRVRTKFAETSSWQKWVPRERVDLRVKAIEQSLDELDTTTEAEKQVESLNTYVEDSEQLLADVVALAAAVKTYDELWPTLELGVEAGEVSAAKRAKTLLNEGFDAPLPDTKGEELKAKATEVADQLALVEAATAAAKTIYIWLGRLKQQAENPPPGAPPSDETKRKALEDAARKVVRATSVDDVEKAYAEANAVAPSAPAQPRALSDMITTRPPAPTIEVDIPVRDGETPGNIDDIFNFRLLNASGAVTWVFGDSRESLGTASDWNPHKYTKTGSFDVEAHGPDGKLLATKTVKVTGPSREGKDQAELAARDRVFTKVAVVLTVASGMLSLYLTDPAWGTSEDYVKALLWGAVISEGVAYVAAILAHLAPGGK